MAVSPAKFYDHAVAPKPVSHAIDRLTARIEIDANLRPRMTLPLATLAGAIVAGLTIWGVVILGAQLLLTALF
jgi:hypothetical protein